MEIEALYSVYKRCGSICTDNRKVQTGQLFVALKGEKFDANDFAESALAAGAAFAIVDKASVVKDHRYILVEDSLKALQELANYHRRQLTCPVIAIAGSNGKTTTKELVHAVLSTTYKTFATPGNLNNHIGVPLSLLSITDDVQMAVIEIGANHRGETAELCRIAQPNMGLITNNGKDHLEGYGSIENVRKANGELYDYFRERGGFVFLYTDALDLVEMASGLHVYTYGEGTENYVSGQAISDSYFLKVRTLKPELSIQTQLFGEYNLPNVLAAIAIGKYHHVSDSNLKRGIEEYVPSGFRSRFVENDGISFILDCYNANPDSMHASLESFAKNGGEDKWVILGDMLELGDYSEEEHENMLEFVSELNFEKVFVVGPEFAKANAEYGFESYANSDDLAAFFESGIPQGKKILLKGSRGIALEKAVSKYI